MTIQPGTPVAPMLGGRPPIGEFDNRLDEGLGCTFEQGTVCAVSPAVAVVRTNQPEDGTVFEGEALCVKHFNTQVSPPRGDSHAALCAGEQVTICCGAYATFHDETLCCKSCWQEVGLGRPDLPDEGDGEIGCTIEIFQRDDEWWMVLSGDLFGPYPTDDAVIDAIPACLRSTF